MIGATAFNPLMSGGNKKSHILKQTCSNELVCILYSYLFFMLLRNNSLSVVLYTRV